jgi:NAD-dependent SIR2 family protein deacetylase
MEIEKLHKALQSADAIVIGAGAGLSTSAGFTYSGERFQQHFADFIGKYGFTDMYSAGFYPFPTEEEKWAYWSRHIYYNRYVPAPKPVYDNLLKLLKDKDYFVITTNVDHQFQKAGFDKKRLFYTQGDYGLFQCAKPCHQKTYNNEDVIKRMIAEQMDMRIPSELVPKCPVCGGPMAMNLRSDETFVEDEGWHAASSHGCRNGVLRDCQRLGAYCPDTCRRLLQPGIGHLADYLPTAWNMDNPCLLLAGQTAENQHPLALPGGGAVPCRDDAWRRLGDEVRYLRRMARGHYDGGQHLDFHPLVVSG